MKTPFFWYYEERFTDWLYPVLLTPVSHLYRVLAREFSRATPLKVSVPVICVGNITAGGAGKTPFVIYLAQFLTAMGKKPHVISRGYGGSSRKIRRVNPDTDNAVLVGDEPLLIAQHAPCWIGRSKKAMAVHAIKNGADVIIMDDGMQNNELHKDLTFMIIDGLAAFGNEKFIPAGPLRESIEDGIKKASAFVIMNFDRLGVESRLGKTKPILHGAYQPRENNLQGQTVLPFAGLARPEKFINTLVELQAEMVGFETFPDHFYYRPIDMERIISRAAAENAIPITTAKDMVRIPEEFRAEIQVVEIDLVIPDEEEAQLKSFLEQALKTGKA